MHVCEWWCWFDYSRICISTYMHPHVRRVQHTIQQQLCVCIAYIQELIKMQCFVDFTINNTSISVHVTWMNLHIYLYSFIDIREIKTFEQQGRRRRIGGPLIKRVYKTFPREISANSENFPNLNFVHPRSCLVSLHLHITFNHSACCVSS